MPRTANTSTQIAKLQKQLAALEKKQAAASNARKSKALAKIVQLAKDAGLSAADVSAALKGGKTPRGRKPGLKKAGTGAKVAPKYRNPANAEQTWTGRGKSPVWVAELKTAGKLDTALIK